MSQPKIRPLAPTMIVSAGVSAQAARPEPRMLISEEMAQRASPPSSTRKPSTQNGSELLIRWSQPACRNGAVAMPPRPSISRARMPYRSSRSPLSWSTPSSSQRPASRAVISTTEAPGDGRVRRTGGALAYGWVMLPECPGRTRCRSADGPAVTESTGRWPVDGVSGCPAGGSCLTSTRTDRAYEHRTPIMTSTPSTTDLLADTRPDDDPRTADPQSDALVGRARCGPG